MVSGRESAMANFRRTGKRMQFSPSENTAVVFNDTDGGHAEIYTVMRDPTSTLEPKRIACLSAVLAGRNKIVTLERNQSVQSASTRPGVSQRRGIEKERQ